MKIFRLFPFAALLIALSLTACKEEIDNDGEFVETAIIYALLDQADTMHYIKITRAFGGTNNSLEVAQIPDSSYFQNLDVVVEEVINNTITRSWQLGANNNFWIHDTILTHKLPGVFYNPEQKVYYFRTPATNPLSTQATYKLRATVNNGEFTVYGETKLVTGMVLNAPNQNAALSFATSNVSQNGYSNAAINVGIGGAAIIDTRIKVYFNEYFSGNPVEKSFTWKIGEVATLNSVNSNHIFYATGKSFYDLMRENITDNASITRRELSRIQIQITGGSEDLYKYIQLSKPASSLAQNKPTYTNLTTSDGRRAIGLFSSRVTLTMEKPEWVNEPPVYYRAIDASSIKELCAGQITGSFLFCSDHPQDIANNVPYTCQ